MENVRILFAIVMFGISLFFVMLLLRNQWVYNSRLYISSADYKLYERLSSYDEMMKRFWIWDAAKFIDYDKNSRSRKFTKVQIKLDKRRRKGLKIIARFQQMNKDKEND